MQSCNKCKQEFPIWNTVDGKKRNLANRKYCLICVPFGTKATRMIDEETNKRNKEGDTRVCKTCSQDFIFFRQKNMTLDKCCACHKKELRKKIKEKAVAYKGGKCERCGYDKYMGAIHFHHLDPSKKDFNFGMNHCRKWEILRQELDKCIALCANCHTETHDEFFK